MLAVPLARCAAECRGGGSVRVLYGFRTRLDVGDDGGQHPEALWFEQQGVSMASSLEAHPHRPPAPRTTRKGREWEGVGGSGREAR